MKVVWVWGLYVYCVARICAGDLLTFTVVIRGAVGSVRLGPGG
jgi:hypothetical protein